jgi:hypothetical protein
VSSESAAPSPPLQPARAMLSPATQIIPEIAFVILPLFRSKSILHGPDQQ